MKLDVQAYLERIRYSGGRTASVETLRRLHRAHLLSVPFENLEVHLGRRVVLDIPSLYDKIVRRRRGGFCYELNGLFAWLLGELGFAVRLLSARVNGGGELGPEFDHLILRVDLEEPWLADVGFGNAFMEPLRLEERGTQAQANREYRLRRDDGELSLQVRRGEEDWQLLYVFTLQPRQFGEFADTCVFHQTSPASHFTQRRICSLPTADGRISLTETQLIETRGDERRERAVESQEEYLRLLRQCFDIELDDPAWEPPNFSKK